MNLWKTYNRLPNKKVVLLQSGGLDSCVCDSILHAAGFEVVELFIDYGQSALEREWEMAQELADMYNHELKRIHLDLPWWHESPLVGGELKTCDVNPVDRIEKSSYIPMRNTVLFSVACSLAESLRYPYICTGITGSQTFFGKPKGGVDAHPNFRKSIEHTFNEGSMYHHKEGGKFTVLAPLLSLSKADVITLGYTFGANMSLSWSCFNGDKMPCGKCSSCVERAEGFYKTGNRDPLLIQLRGRKN